MAIKPLKTLENRAWRSYLGGKMLDEFRGREGTDGYFPEDWLASVVTAVNPEREGKPELEGQSQVVMEDGTIAYLRDIINSDVYTYLGKEHVEKFGNNFGVLTKFLDAAEKLPVQVHPDKPTAKRLFNSDYGKTEAWYILDGRTIDGEEPYILFGFKEDVTAEQLRELFDKQDIKAMENLMHKLPAKAGDVFIIHGGVPHAIGGGCFLLEVQEPTDYTISLEKCNSLGEPMPDEFCHMGIGFDKMFECFNYVKYSHEELLKKFKLTPQKLDENTESLIAYDTTTCFALNRITVKDLLHREPQGNPSALTVVAGSGTLAGMDVKRGDCLFIPAKCDPFDISGTMTLLECLPPQL